MTSLQHQPLLGLLAHPVLPLLVSANFNSHPQPLTEHIHIPPSFPYPLLLLPPSLPPSLLPPPLERELTPVVLARQRRCVKLLGWVPKLAFATGEAGAVVTLPLLDRTGLVPQDVHQSPEEENGQENEDRQGDVWEEEML